MKGLFVELPAFSRHRADYLDDEGFRALQSELAENPAKGDVIEGTGGLRKLRRPDRKRGKGKRGGLRVIYFWWEAGRQFWLGAFTEVLLEELSGVSVKPEAPQFPSEPLRMISLRRFRFSRAVLNI